VAVSPIHHRRDGETAGEWGGCGGDWGHWGYGIGVAGRWGSLSDWARLLRSVWLCFDQVEVEGNDCVKFAFVLAMSYNVFQVGCTIRMRSLKNIDRKIRLAVVIG